MEMEFEVWEKEVDKLLLAAVGLDSFGSDWDYWYAWNEGMTPAEAVGKILKRRVATDAAAGR